MPGYPVASDEVDTYDMGMLTVATRIATHPHTMTALAGYLVAGGSTLGVFSGWHATDWLQLLGALVGLILSFIAGKHS